MNKEILSLENIQRKKLRRRSRNITKYERDSLCDLTRKLQKVFESDFIWNLKHTLKHVGDMLAVNLKQKAK